MEHYDGTVETVLIRTLEEQFESRDDDWVRGEHARLKRKLASECGIRRCHWLRLRALECVIKLRSMGDARRKEDTTWVFIPQ